MKVSTNGVCHMTKVAAVSIYAKNSFSETKRPMTLKLDMRHWLLEYFQVCSNDDPGLTLTYFTAGSTLVPFVVVVFLIFFIYLFIYFFFFFFVRENLSCRLPRNY